MDSSWSGLLYIEELLVKEKDQIILKKNNLKNVFHTGGQTLFLSCMFKNTSVPNDYYVGLDNRNSISPNQTMADISGEPTVAGYSRQTLVKNTDFNFIPDSNPVKIRSSTITFGTTSESYSATNMFLCTVLTGTSGILISTISFGTTISVTPSKTVSMKFAMTLGTC